MSRYLNSPREADWYACPNCGHEVRVGSEGCRKCHGQAPGESGEGDWPDGLDLPEDSEVFDHEAWEKKEFGSASKLKPADLPWKFWIGGVAVLLALLWMAIFSGYIH